MKLYFMVQTVMCLLVAKSRYNTFALLHSYNCNNAAGSTRTPKCKTYSGKNDVRYKVPLLLALKTENKKVEQESSQDYLTNSSKTKENPAIVRNRQIIDLGRQQKWKDILLLYEREGDDFNRINYATTMNQLGKMRSLDSTLERLFITFLNDLINKLKLWGVSWMGARGVAIIIHAIGKLQQLPSQTGNNTNNMAATSSRIRTRMLVRVCVTNKENAKWLVRYGNSQDISNIAWSCAKLGIMDKESEIFFSEVRKRSKRIVTKGNSQTIANTVWACAKLQMDAPKLFSAVDQHSKWIIKEANCQELANIAWAFATLNVKAPKLFSQIERRAGWFVFHANTQEIANMAWAFATLGVLQSPSLPSPGLFACIEKRSSWFVRCGRTQEIGNTAWAFGTLGIQSFKLFSQIEKRAQRLVSSSNPQEIANIAWACGTLKFKAPIFFREVDIRAKWLVREGSPQAIANTAWASAKLGIPLPTLFSELDNHAKWFVNEGCTQEIANSIWAGAKLRLEMPHLMDEIEVNAHWFVSNGSPQAIANVAWACAVVGIPSPKLFLEIHKRSSWLVKKGSDQDIENTLWAITTFNSTIADENRLLLEFQQTKQEDKNANPAIVRNKKITDLGRKKNWKGMLQIHEAERTEFDHINYATVMNYLSFILSLDYEDVAFNAFLDDLAGQLESRGIEWIGARGAANIISSIGTMELKSPNAKRIALFISKEANAEWLSKNGTPEDVANTAWACATLGIFWR